MSVEKCADTTKEPARYEEVLSILEDEVKSLDHQIRRLDQTLVVPRPQDNCDAGAEPESISVFERLKKLRMQLSICNGMLEDLNTQASQELGDLKLIG